MEVFHWKKNCCINGKEKAKCLSVILLEQFFSVLYRVIGILAFLNPLMPGGNKKGTHT